MWLSDFTLVLPDRIVERGSIRLEGKRIAEVAEKPVPGGVAGDGLHLMAGFIDMHGDMIELELEPRPRVEMPMELALNSLDARLAAAGVTTAYASVSFSRGVKDGERRSFSHTSNVIRQLHASRRGLRVDHKIHARFDIKFDDAVEVIEALIRDEQVDLVSLMDHTPGQGQYRDIERFIKQLAHNQGISEDQARDHVADRLQAGKAAAPKIAQIMDEVAELCREHHVALASHDDDTIDKVAWMARLGATISEFPVTFEAAEAARARGMMVAMGAPNALRGKSYSGNLSARDTHAAGLLQILAADYHPGAILPAVKVLAAADPEGLVGAARLANANPAQALGLEDRGHIAAGMRADFCIADMSGIGRVVASYSAGTQAYSDGTLAGRSPVPQVRSA